ncbi:RING-type E3 ubiquitin transferase [Malassezia caprae]|uniref:RING-type E3 ubiquitin transferase n=1 Tax=Malassezia caprae TaxID=1381934 RepID=A0AAF0E3J6_9BASI|nr:RING-type E3 ubiquitin transferase [Malassezia caprae]
MPRTPAGVAPRGGAELATYVDTPAAGVTSSRKRAYADVDACTVFSETLYFDVNATHPSALRYAGAVDVRIVADRAARMQPGILMHTEHAALLDLVVGDGPWLTVPLSYATAQWLHAALTLRTWYVQASAACDEASLALTLHVLATPAAFAPATPSDADRVLTLVEHARALDGAACAGDLQADDATGAAMVYSALCARESERDTQMPAAEQPRGLLAPLLPFQRRSLSFLLEREAPPTARHTLRMPCGPWWVQVGARPLYAHVLTGALCDDSARVAAEDVRGAMLAEEMGLGKTVEVLALLLEHTSRARHEEPSYWDAANETQVQPVGTTLIVSPEILRRQWLEEIQVHAPSLRVYSYTGHRDAAAHRAQAGHTSWGAWAQDMDVMVVSFETLARDLAASHAAPVRSLRHPKKYERPRSPLVQLDFWRVVMDEVQLVGGNAARTMGMIRRCMSVAVSGTPVRQLADLRTSLWFLGLVPGSTTPATWKRILGARLAPYVYQALRQIGIRHTKAQVQHEMVLPPQTRYLVPVDFTHVETAFYKDVWHASLAALELDPDGAPLTETWELDTAVLRAQLQRLRQACTHPHVALRGGHTLGAGDGASGAGAVNLRSIDHVLTQMIEAAHQDLLTQKQALVSRRIFRASVLLFAPRDELMAQVAACSTASLGADEQAVISTLATRPCLDVARDEWETLLPEALAHVEGLQRDIVAAHERGPLYAFTAAELAAEAAWGKDVPADAPHEKLRLRQQHVSALKSRQRHWLQTVHRIQQFSGHCYFQLGEAELSQRADPPQALKKEPEGPWASIKSESTFTPLEDAAYQAAEATRQRLLADAREMVEQSVHALRQHAVDTRDLTPADPPVVGLAGRSVLEHVSERLEQLRAHAKLTLDWRAQIHERLTKPVNREVDKARENDDIYAENLDAQIEAETLLEMYRPLLAQRDELLTGRIALGATARPQLFVELDRELRAVRARRWVGSGDDDEETDDDDAVRQAKRLQLAHFRTLEQARRAVMLPPEEPPLLGLMGALKDARDACVRAEELSALSAAYAALQALQRRQTELLESLRREQMHFQTVFNARALYFKQMQELSDQVQDPDLSLGIVPSLLHAVAQERAVRQRIGAMEGRLRYLRHVEQMQRASGAGDEELRHCFICTNPIERGVLTNACGHLCCETCFHAWMAHGHRTCPMCKTRIAPRDIHRVVYRVPEPMAPSATPAAPSAYRVLPSNTRQALHRLSIEGGIGSKLDGLMRHLLHLQRTTGEKSLVFSSFARGLDLVAESLERHGLEYARLDGTGGKRAGAQVDAFQHGPTVRVLLLHSEAQSAGLNLLAATHLFLLEPLLNHALELQAIGRVHRIGQTRPTHVYGYMVNDTVEERIVGLAATRGQSLYLDDAAEPDSAMVQAAHLATAQDVSREARRGDLIGTADDLLACLFSQHLGAAR